MSVSQERKHSKENPTVVITGAAGFIGSCLLRHFGDYSHINIIAVDDFSIERKSKNFESKRINQQFDRSVFLAWFAEAAAQVDFVLHIGARTDTTEQNLDLLNALNLEYSKQIWNICTEFQIPMIYASSAATYGNGEFGYDDNHEGLHLLKPMNPYGVSKHSFDLWVLKQTKSPPFWAGLKFFNVYGPNEYHKGRMASVVYQTFQQISSTGKMKLFRSHKPEVADGYQSRDFVYVKDVVSVIWYLFQNKPHSAIFNLGSGVANPFYDLAKYTFEALDLEANISFIDTPEDIRSTYQYYTCAEMKKLIESGYHQKFYSLEEGVYDYVQNYLMKGAYY